MSNWFSLTRITLALFVAPLIAPGGPTKAHAGGTAEKKHAYAPVNGLKMYYEIHGAGDTPLVLLHGGGSSIATTFGKILPALAKSRQVIAFEQQGHGRTADVAERPFTFEQSADDAAALLKHLKIKQADLFGFSNGGHIAMQVAIRYPNIVRKLVVASAGFKREGHYPEFWEFMKQAKLETMPKALRDEYAKLSPHPEKLPTFFDKSVKRMREFKDIPVEVIRSITAPTFVMIGDADNVRPEHSVEMFRLLPHGKLAVLPGGHGAYIGEVTAARLEYSKVLFGDARKDSKRPGMVVAMIEEFLDAPMPEPKGKKTTRAPQKPKDWPRYITSTIGWLAVTFTGSDGAGARSRSRTASSTTPIPPMRADWTASGACISGSTAPPRVATRRAASGGDGTMNTIKVERSLRAASELLSRISWRLGGLHRPAANSMS